MDIQGRPIMVRMCSDLLGPTEAQLKKKKKKKNITGIIIAAVLIAVIAWIAYA